MAKNPTRVGPEPWFGCDTTSRAWISYCEAWEHAFRNKGNLRSLIHDRRGKAAVAALDHNIEVVKRDYRGEIEDRTELPRLLK